jgi:hypothetical protein
VKANKRDETVTARSFGRGSGRFSALRCAQFAVTPQAEHDGFSRKFSFRSRPGLRRRDPRPNVAPRGDKHRDEGDAFAAVSLHDLIGIAVVARGHLTGTACHMSSCREGRERSGVSAGKRVPRDGGNTTPFALAHSRRPAFYPSHQ